MNLKITICENRPFVAAADFAEFANISPETLTQWIKDDWFYEFKFYSNVRLDQGGYLMDFDHCVLALRLATEMNNADFLEKITAIKKVLIGRCESTPLKYD